ncbi:uncharacterized protein LOC110460136 [Mizuhopecten yessoensis]|uniref:uncharacterized protein LOC110460136 n=1 Tax=Mizuhopecten yessoensis TaxID=6573 RepID=UPI000B45F006|nr:uncharacterized protein LOC110460136 [Mizuhopecten yessoensis]
MKNILAIGVFACFCVAVFGDGYGNGGNKGPVNQFWNSEPSLHRHGAIGLYPNNIHLAGNFFQYQAHKPAPMFNGPKKIVNHNYGGKRFNGYGSPNVGAPGGQYPPVMPRPYHGYGESVMGFSGGFDPYYVDPRPGVPETLDYLVGRGGEFVKKNWQSLALAGAGLYLLNKN